MRFSSTFYLVVMISSVFCKHDNKEYETPNTFKKDKDQTRFQLLTLLAYASTHYMGNTELNKVDEISIVTWNILAPIWTDEKALNETGLVDINLLDINMRLKLIIRKLLETNADVITLQETQEDTHRIIANGIKSEYVALAHSSHGKKHWEDDKLDANYVKNGVSTFYKREKFVLSSAEKFLLSDNGNYALGAVLRMKKRQYQKDHLVGPPIIVANVHLQHNAELKDALLRRAQIHSLVEWTTKTKNELIKNTHGNPLTFLSGDFNTDTGYPAWEYITSLGFVDAKKALNVPTSVLTIFYATPFFSKALNRTFNGVFLDRVFVEKSEIDAGRVDFKSFTIPNVMSEELSEKEHNLKAFDILQEELKTNGKNFQKNVKSFLKLMKSLSDDNEYDQKFNRALRLGSDHLPVLISFNIKHKEKI